MKIDTTPKITHRLRFGSPKLRPLSDGLRHIRFKLLARLNHPVGKIGVLFTMVLILAGGLRTLPIASFSIWPEFSQKRIAIRADAFQYWYFARLIHDHGLAGLMNKDADQSTKLIKSINTGKPITAFRTPFYPFFLAANLRVFGEQPVQIFYVQVALEFFTMLIIFLITRPLSGPKVAVLATFLYAINPVAIRYTASLYADCFFVFLFTFSLLIFIRTLSAPSPRRHGWAGMLFGLSALTKPVALYFWIVALIVILLSQQREKGKACFSFLLGFFLALAPWQLRNRLVYGHYSLTFMQGRELLVWRVGTCMAWNQGMTIPQKEALWASLQEPYQVIADPFLRSELQGEAAWRYIRNHPLQMLGCHADGMSNFYFPRTVFSANSASSPVANMFLRQVMTDPSRQAWSRMYFFIGLIGGYLLAVVGLWTVLSQGRRDHGKAIVGFLLFCPIFYFPQMASVDGSARYAYAILPSLCILTSIGISVIKPHRWWKGRSAHGNRERC